MRCILLVLIFFCASILVNVFLLAKMKLYSVICNTRVVGVCEKLSMLISYEAIVNGTMDRGIYIYLFLYLWFSVGDKAS